MKSRAETLRIIEEISTMTPEEMAINSEFIRETLVHAMAHIIVLRNDRDRAKRRGGTIPGRKK